MKNKAQKNGYKHTLQKRFLTLLLVSIILASGMIGGAGIASAQRVINEDSSQIMNLLCEQKASEINLMLKETPVRSTWIILMFPEGFHRMIYVERYGIHGRLYAACA